MVAASLLACSCGGGESPVTRQITVTGNGVAHAEPDVAAVVFGVDVSSSDPADAVNDATARMSAAREAALGAGVDSSDISTTSYSLWIENVWDPVNYQYTGEMLYHVSHYETMDIRALDSVGTVLAALVNAGVNSISSVSFRVEDQSALFAHAREAAVADAGGRAESMARALGVTLGEPVYVTEYGGGYVDYGCFDQFASTGRASGEMTAVPSITPGSFSTSASVTVTYAIE
jgi:hypothetical protein